MSAGLPTGKVLPGFGAGCTLVVCSLLLVGCGSSDDPTKIRQTISSYFDALASGDGTKACTQLTGNERRMFVASTAARLPEFHATTCADAISKLAANVGADETSRLKHANITKIAVKGQTATATIAGATKQATLTKTDGQWLIAGGLN